MGLDLNAIDHACNVVRREIQEEFPDLSLFYLVSPTGERGKILEKKKAELLAQSGGQALLALAAASTEKDGAEFSGISLTVEKKIFGLKKREKLLACFFVSPEKLESPDDARRQALFLAWQALSLAEDYRNEKTDHFKKSGDIIFPAADKKITAWKNMLADAFSVLVLEMENRRDSIGKLGRSRSFSALFTAPRALPENYPFPLVLDAARLVFHDMDKMPGENPIIKALGMAHEIGETFDISSIRQWWAFVRPAQEMAWLGVEQNTILGAAAYNSEDPYARATAYLVAEALNIQTLMPIGAGLYNPFAEMEVNERHHLRACEETLRELPDMSPASIMKSALRKNRKLLEGQPLGWCTPALMLAAGAPPEKAKQVFEQAVADLPWEKIQLLIRLIVRLRRQGHEVTNQFLAEKLKSNEELQFLADCFASEQ